jgi:hypothetical protein
LTQSLNDKGSAVSAGSPEQLRHLQDQVRTRDLIIDMLYVPSNSINVRRKEEAERREMEIQRPAENVFESLEPGLRFPTSMPTSNPLASFLKIPIDRGTKPGIPGPIRTVDAPKKDTTLRGLDHSQRISRTQLADNQSSTHASLDTHTLANGTISIEGEALEKEVDAALDELFNE